MTADDRIAERRLADEIGAEHDAARAVVAVDGGRALAELELGDGRQRHGGARGGRDLQLFDELAVLARLFVELHADRHLAVADVELGEVGADVADGGDAHGFGDGLGRDAELRRLL